MNIILFFMNDLKRPIVTNLTVSDSIEKVLFLIEKYFNLSSEKVLILSEYGINLTEQNSQPLSQFISEGENTLKIFIFRFPINVDKDFTYQVVKNPNSVSSILDAKKPSKIFEKSRKAVANELERLNIHINSNIIFFQELLEISNLYNKGLRAVKKFMKLTALLYEKNIQNLHKVSNESEKIVSVIEGMPEKFQDVIEFFNTHNLLNGEKLSLWFKKNVLNDEITCIFKEYEDLKKRVDYERRPIEHPYSQTISDEEKKLLNLNECDYYIEITSILRDLNDVNMQILSIINKIEGNDAANKRTLSLSKDSEAYSRQLKTIENNIIESELKFQTFFKNFNEYINSMNSKIDDTFKRSRNILLNQQPITKYSELLMNFIKKSQLVLNIISTPSIIRYLKSEIASQAEFIPKLTEYKTEAYKIWNEAITQEIIRRKNIEKIISRHFISKLYTPDTTLELKNIVFDKNTFNINEIIHKDNIKNNTKNSGIETVLDKSDPLYIDNNQGMLDCDAVSTKMSKKEILAEGLVINPSNEVEDVNGIPRTQSFCVPKNRSKKYHNILLPQKSTRNNSEGSNCDQNLDKKRSYEKYVSILVTKFANAQLDYQNEFYNLIINVHEANEEKQALENQVEELKQQIRTMKDKENEENKNPLRNDVIKKGEIVSFIYDHRINIYFVAINPNSKSCPYFLSTDDPIYNKDKNEREPFFIATVKSIRSATIKMDENRFKLKKGTVFYLITIENK